MARRVARPLALRVTWVIAPWGISAHAMTFVALATAMAAAGCFAGGTAWAWLAGAMLLQTWYLFDHVDGQLARLRQQETLDGAALDYYMHHVVNLLLPLGLGWGVFSATQRGLWMLAGVAASLGMVSISLVHDIRYKAFTKRLKRVRGELCVRGGGGAKPAPQPAAPRSLTRRVVWIARKACEIHVLMNVLTLAAIVMCLAGDRALIIAQVLLASLALLALGVAALQLLRGLHTEAAEREFVAWYVPPHDATLVLSAGWWDVVACDDLPATRPDRTFGDQQPARED